MSFFNGNNKPARGAMQPDCPAQGEQPQGKKTFVQPTLEVILFDADALTDIVIASNINPETGELFGNDQDEVTIP